MACLIYPRPVTRDARRCGSGCQRRAGEAEYSLPTPPPPTASGTPDLPGDSRFRANAFEAYRRNIDKTRSAHREYYEQVEKRLGGEKAPPFTLPPEAGRDK